MLIRYGDEPQLSPFTILCNTGDGGVFSNVRANLAQGYAKFVEAKEKETRPALLCGSGPSLADSLESIRAMKKRGAFIIAMNGTGRYLAKNGIRADALAMVDPRKENIEFLEKAWAPEAWLASQCDPGVCEQAEKVGMRVVLWHPGIPGIQTHIPSADSLRMGGGITVGLCSLYLAYVSGFRELHLFGFDGSHRENKGHAFEQARNANDETVLATVDSKQFVCSVAMAGQATEWNATYKWLLKEGCEVHVHGDGLLPAMWRAEQRRRQLRVLSAVYDLGVSPPTYDVMSFLAEAERHRLAHGQDVIDLYFQPGPMHGFRSDDLPPDAQTRHAMLWRVCVGIARLLPSVRNIHVLAERSTLSGDVFPDGWAEDQPRSQYGIKYQRDAQAIFRASAFARKWAEQFPARYATITLRQSTYWPTRNSNLEAWFEVAKWLTAQGIWPVFVPDTDAQFASPAYTVCREAAWDVDLRAALYERAQVNMGVANGPMWLAPYLDAPYLVFNVGDGSTLSSSTEFLLSHGVARGDEEAFGGNGRAIWKPDTAANILAELQDFTTQLKEKTS